MQISVIVLTYEPRVDKLLATLASIIDQKGIMFELILSDDGSKNINIEDIEKKVFEIVPKSIPLRFIKNSKNSGTVSNVYNACKYATGEYIKLISPGDLLFDDSVLYDLYAYAKDYPQNSFFFGRAVYYYNDETIKTLTTSTPLFPRIFNSKDQRVQDLAVMFGFGPVGASYFYKTVDFIKYLELIKDHVKYTEDYTTSILYLLDGGKLSFIDRKVVWYEYGHGISTSNSDRWKVIYEADCKELYGIARQLHANNPYLEFRFGDRKKRVFHPFIILSVIWIKFISHCKAEKNSTSIEQVNYLKHCMEIGT